MDLLEHIALLTPCIQDLPGAYQRRPMLQPLLDFRGVCPIITRICQPVRQVWGYVRLAGKVYILYSNNTQRMLCYCSTILAVTVAARAFPVSYNLL